MTITNGLSLGSAGPAGTGETLTRSHTPDVRHAWEVYRRAVAGIAWPEEVAGAVMDLRAALAEYSLARNGFGAEKGTHVGELLDKYAAWVSEAVVYLTRIIRTAEPELASRETGGTAADLRAERQAGRQLA